ncbi:hypothetical protein ACH0R4_RS07085 [Bacillus cytotoxicus]|uniref:hypothetical protein n=1 Tax=Bacillus cereus group sp. BfR-BA-01492 TaxID=2920361 RepID=UPI001F5A6BB5|nr:hypothetical protein [Bacillus cereus group sp. BfR-BA-01492]EMA6343571.1 hypothetical protein [Bacillus cytotoxicus]
MNKLFDTLKNAFLDLFSMGKGFIYEFIMASLFIVIGSALLFGILLFTSLIF